MIDSIITMDHLKVCCWCLKTPLVQKWWYKLVLWQAWCLPVPGGSLSSLMWFQIQRWSPALQRRAPEKPAAPTLLCTVHDCHHQQLPDLQVSGDGTGWGRQHTSMQLLPWTLNVSLQRIHRQSEKEVPENWSRGGPMSESAKHGWDSRCYC